MIVQAAEDIHLGDIHSPLFNDRRIDISVDSRLIVPQSHSAYPTFRAGKASEISIVHTVQIKDIIG